MKKRAPKTGDRRANRFEVPASAAERKMFESAADAEGETLGLWSLNACRVAAGDEPLKRETVEPPPLKQED